MHAEPLGRGVLDKVRELTEALLKLSVEFQDALREPAGLCAGDARVQVLEAAPPASDVRDLRGGESAASVDTEIDRAEQRQQHVERGRSFTRHHLASGQQDPKTLRRRIGLRFGQALDIESQHGERSTYGVER